MADGHVAVPALSRTVRLMVAVDVGFLAYWLAIGLALFPPEWMFADYADPQVVAWNWSFLPLDLVASATGLAAARALHRGRAGAEPLLATSLSLTATAGGMAIAYWSLLGQFAPGWLAPNVFLLLFPLPALIALVRGRGPSRSPGAGSA